jgi:hypothetical protein
MTKEEIIEMGKQSGCEIRNGHIYNQYVGSLDQMLKKFAKLVEEKVIADQHEFIKRFNGDAENLLKEKGWHK